MKTNVTYRDIKGGGRDAQEIYEEFVAIRKKLQSIRRAMESFHKPLTIDEINHQLAGAMKGGAEAGDGRENEKNYHYLQCS